MKKLSEVLPDVDVAAARVEQLKYTLRAIQSRLQRTITWEVCVQVPPGMSQKAGGGSGLQAEYLKYTPGDGLQYRVPGARAGLDKWEAEDVFVVAAVLPLLLDKINSTATTRLSEMSPRLAEAEATLSTLEGCMGYGIAQGVEGPMLGELHASPSPSSIGQGSGTGQHTCFVLGKLENVDGHHWVLTSVMTCGEDPQHMTKYFKDRYVVMSTGHGHDFQAALDEAVAIYMGSMPDIYALFPL